MSALTTWINNAETALRITQASMHGGELMALDKAVDAVRVVARSISSAVGGQTIFIGNGGSAATAAHMAVDWSLANMRSIALVDGVALSSHANDYGVEEMFVKQLELLGTRAPCLLVAMSASGRSKNIIRAAEYARSTGMGVVTFSGFDANNDLRKLGDMNFYTPDWRGGFVQLAQFALLHAICDQQRIADGI